MKKVYNDKFHTIYTVVILDNFEWESADLSTVSFEKFDDAVDYCLAELGEEDNEEVRKELITQMYYNDGDVRYYIEEANLIH